MNLINDYQFYPTPAQLGHKMASKVDWKRVSTILEPSAGKGDLIEVIAFHKHGNLSIDCCEIDKSLVAIIKNNFKQKEYNCNRYDKTVRVVHDDFFNVQSV